MSSQVGEKDDMKFKIKMNRQSPIYREIIFQNKINEEKRISIDTNWILELKKVLLGIKRLYKSDQLSRIKLSMF